MIHRYAEVDSTQRVARELAMAGAPHGEAVLAAVQTAGRGRLGRVWLSEPGENLLMSVVLRPAGPARDAPLLSLGAAAGLAVTFGLFVKWPNDLVTRDGRKVGGLLAEMDAREDRIGHVILGLGLNVNQRSFSEGVVAASLAQLGEEGLDVEDWRRGDRLDVGLVAEAALRAILAWSDHPDRLDQWRRRSHTLGRRVRVAGREGIATGITAEGALLVDGEPVTTGEVAMVEALPSSA